MLVDIFATRDLFIPPFSAPCMFALEGIPFLVHTTHLQHNICSSHSVSTGYVGQLLLAAAMLSG